MRSRYRVLNDRFVNMDALRKRPCLPLAPLQVPRHLMKYAPMIGVRLFIIAALAAIGLAGCDNKPVADGAPPPPPVTVSKPLQKPITEWDEYTGRFEALATVEVRARVSGFIDSIHFRDGQIVQQGALLFIIDQRPYQIAVDQAKADLERARAKYDIATADVDR